MIRLVNQIETEQKTSKAMEINHIDLKVRSKNGFVRNGKLPEIFFEWIGAITL